MVRKEGEMDREVNGFSPSLPSFSITINRPYSRFSCCFTVIGCRDMALTDWNEANQQLV